MARRAREQSLHRERLRTEGEEHRGRDAPAPRAECCAAYRQGAGEEHQGRAVAAHWALRNQRPVAQSALPPSTCTASARRRGGSQG